MSHHDTGKNPFGLLFTQILLHGRNNESSSYKTTEGDSQMTISDIPQRIQKALALLVLIIGLSSLSFFIAWVNSTHPQISFSVQIWLGSALVLLGLNFPSILTTIYEIFDCEPGRSRLSGTSLMVATFVILITGSALAVIELTTITELRVAFVILFAIIGLWRFFPKLKSM